MALVVFSSFYFYSKDNHNKHNSVAQSLARDFSNNPNLEPYELRSPYKLASSTEDFMEAPLRVTVFSDFQCPHCKVLAENLQQIINHYKGRINVQYVFFPLDSHCNDNVEIPAHPQACQAAYYSVCGKADNFAIIHDQLYLNQNDFNEGYFVKLAEKHKLSQCMSSEETRSTVKKQIAAAEYFDISATPTMVINGRKFEVYYLLSF